MKPRSDIAFLVDSERHRKIKDSETETEFYVERHEKIESIHTAAFGTTLDLVWPSAESVPDAIEP